MADGDAKSISVPRIPAARRELEDACDEATVRRAGRWRVVPLRIHRLVREREVEMCPVVVFLRASWLQEVAKGGGDRIRKEGAIRRERIFRACLSSRRFDLQNDPDLPEEVATSRQRISNALISEGWRRTPDTRPFPDEDDVWEGHEVPPGERPDGISNSMRRQYLRIRYRAGQLIRGMSD